MLVPLAASILLGVVARADDLQGDLSPKEQEVWQRLQKSFATLQVRGVPSGTAALIDQSGLYLAHQTSVDSTPDGPAVYGTLSNGKSLRFAVIGKDSLTKLTLLQAIGWQSEYGTPVRVPVGDEVGHGMVFAVLPNGPIRAAFTKLNFAGLVREERRIIPLNEVQFEAPEGGCAGALLIDEDGELLGVLNATLSKDDLVSAQAPVTALSGGFGGGGRGPTYAAANSVARVLRGRGQMSPANLTVAYTAGVAVLKRVVEGFRSPSHHVAYPSLGLLCIDAPRTGGALVQAVQPASPADIAGIRVGDVLTMIAGVQIRNQVDFAMVMLDQTPGDTIVVQYHRRARNLVQPVVVGHS